MNSNELRAAELKNPEDYIALAHRLRAEAMRNGLLATGRALKRATHAVSARFHRSAHA